MCEVLNTLEIATHVDHLWEPSLPQAGSREISCELRVAGVALFFFATIFTVGIGAIYLLYTANEKRLQANQGIQQIEQFWQQDINAFALSHGTTSLYAAHFKRHGISATYPAELHEIIAKVIRLWSAHENRVPKTGYFRLFKQRYDASMAQKRVAFSFSADPEITEEYTTGARGHGGEWMREIRNFLRDVLEHKHLFTHEEQETLSQMRALSEVLRLVPPMIVEIPAGTEAFRRLMFGRGGRNSPFMQQHFFVDFVKSGCDWRNPQALSTFLNNHRTLIGREKSKLSQGYEVTVEFEVPARDLRFRLVGRIPTQAMLDRLSPQEKYWVQVFKCASLFSNEALTPSLALS